MKKVDVLILAGGTLPDDLKKYSSGYDNRALLKIGGRYMIEYVVDALNGAEEVDKILVVGPVDPLRDVLAGRVIQVVEAEDTMLGNLWLGIEKFKDADRLIISSCDIPLVTADMVSRFLRECEKVKGDVYYPIINKKYNDEKFPKTKRTYFNLKDGVFTGGNLVLLNPLVIRRNWEMLEQAIAGRKNVMKMLRLIGISFIIRYVLGILTLEMLENKVKQIVGMDGGAVQVTDPEIGVDVDKESDYLLVKNVIENRA